MNERFLIKMAGILKAMGHPTRVKILNILNTDERCVCELMALINEEQASISKHLSVLKSAELVEARKVGVSVYYRVSDKQTLELLTIVEDILKNKINKNYQTIDTSDVND